MRLWTMFFITIALSVMTGSPCRAQSATPRAEVIFPDGAKVSVEIADTDVKRQRGLMFRQKMAANEGMIFIFDRVGFYPFWMKNTLIPLDMLWLAGDGKTVSIAESVPPCRADPCPTYSPGGDALYVVEVVSGFVRQHGVKVGDTLLLKGLGKRGNERRNEGK